MVLRQAKWMMGAAAVLASAGAASAMSQTIADAVDALDADDFALREAATLVLSTDPDVSDEALSLKMGAGVLSAEAQARLYTAMRDRFVRSARGAIGIRFEGMGTRVGATYENFPAHDAGLIKEGDVIVGVSGRALSQDDAGRNELVVETFSHEPGETLRLRVARVDERGEVREIDIETTLGSIDRFPQQEMNAWRDSIYRAAFERRMERLGIEPETRTFRADIETAAWAGLADQRMALLRRANPASRSSRVLAGPVEGSVSVFGGVHLTLNGNGRAALVRVPVVPQQALRGEDVEALRRRAEVLRAQRINVGGNANVNVQVGGGNVQWPEELADQVQRRRAEAQAQAQRKAMLARLDAADERNEEIAGIDTSNPVETANRLAARIGRLESEVAQQERLLRAGGGDDAGIQRMAEERITELRTTLLKLEVRLRRAMAMAEDAGLESETEASVGEE